MPKLRLNKDQDSGNVGGDQNNEIVDVPPSRKTKAGALPSNDEVVEAKSGDARKPHLTRINNSPLKKVLERASQLVATGMALPQPEHMALQVLQELGIEVSENIRQELLNLGLAAATKKSVDRSQDLLVAVSEAAGQGTPELKHLKEVLATSNERFGTLFQQGLADHEMAMLAAPPEYTPMTRAELEQSASRLSTIMSLNPTDMVLAALGKEDGSGGYDPVIGREEEIRELVIQLAQTDGGSATLIGEAGVGKTSLLQGMASAIAEGSLVGPLEKARIYNVRPDQLEMALQGGAGASCGPNGCSTGSGGFVQSLLSEIQSVSQDHPVILVIDEFHALIESQAGRAMLDSLKPAIAEGTLKIVGITTREEYRTALGAAAQNASALRRRFPPREIKEKTPDADKLDLMKILYSKIPRYVAAADNLVRVDASAVLRAVELSPHIREQTDESHISASVQILANAVSRVRAQLEGEPPAIRELRSAVANTNRALQSAKNGKTTEDEKARDRLAEEYRSQSEQLTELLRQNEEERPLVFQIVELENQLDQLAVSAEDGAAATIASIVTELEELRGQLEEVLEGRDPLYHPVVNAETIAKSVSEMTGNDIEALQSLDQEKVLRAEEILSDKIKGQPEAIRVLANAAKRFYSGMQDKTRPWLVAHFAGGTGAGKSDLLEIYAKEFFGNNMLTFNGSEMQEGHRTSYIIGAPQGYVGYDKGGSLAEFARAVPYGVVAVNELDKAHPNVRRLLMEAKEDGYITDADGRRVSVAHLCFVDTSNYGENETQHLVDDKGFKDRGAAEQILRQVLVQALTQAVYNRYDEVVLFNPLTRSLMSEIADKFIRDARSDFEASHNIYIDATPEARQWLATNGYDQQMGARPLRRLVAREIRDQLSDRYLLPDSDPKAIRQGLFVMADIAPDGKGLTLRRMAPEEKAKAAAERANRKEEAGSKSKRRRTPPDPAASAKADVERAAAAPSE